MTTPDQLAAIFERIAEGKHTKADIAALQQALRLGNRQDLVQVGKYNINIGEGQDIQIGDRTYVTWNDEAIQALIEVVQKQLPKQTGIPANLPYSGVVEFVGRDAVMSQLHQMLQQGHRVAVSAIAGMGGVGKTELALQYALKYQPTYQAGICWLSARGVDVGTQIVQFGRSLLDLNPPEDVELLEQVTFCWRHWQAGEVLLVFDNVTDYAAIKPYLPPSTASRFKVLITTRLRLGASVNQLELEVLDESAALALLESLVGSERIQTERDCAQQLGAQLGYLPLGLELVGRYLARKPDLSLAAMQQRLQSKRLAARALRQTDDDMTARSGVAAAFELSWETLSENAKSLGYLLSLFAAAPILWSLVELCLADQDPEDLEEVRDSELLNLHLLQRTNPETYRLHPLIRDFFQTKLAQSPHPDALKQQYCQVMAEVARLVSEEPTRQQILAVALAIPHVEEVATQLQDWLNNEDLIAPYEGLGNFYKGLGNYTLTEHWYGQCCLVSETRLGANHLDTATCLNAMAMLYVYQRRYSEAESLFQRSLTIREQQLGIAHPDVATSLNNLATLYSQQERYGEAELLFQHTLKLLVQQLGSDHLLVAMGHDNLATLYQHQERYSESEALYQKSLTILRQQLGDDHLDVAICLNNLAGLYRKQGRYSEAEQAFQRSLAIREQQFGSDHPHVATCLCNLADFYYAQGRYSEAEPLYQRSLRMIEKLGADHPDVANIVNNLAVLYYEQGRYNEAEPFCRRSLRMSEELGADYPDEANSLYNLAKLRREQGYYSEAEFFLQKALNILKQTHGDTHPDIGLVLVHLAKLRSAEGQNTAAETLYSEALEIFERLLGAEHSWAVRCREDLEQLRSRS